MSCILYELFYGKINPFERRIEQTPEYDTATQALISLENELLSTFDDGQKELYKQLTFALSAVQTIENAQLYKEAFKLGAKITLECFSK